MSVKEKLKSIPAVRWLGRAVKYAPMEIAASLDLLAERRISRVGVIRVGFLCQYLPAWDKLEPIYQKMKADERFEPVLIAVPDRIKNHRLQDPRAENETYAYLISHGYPEAKNAHLGQERWLDPKQLDLSYMFCVRPYDDLLPEPYTTKALSRHCRLCLMMYGMTIAREDRDIAVNRSFMSRLYLHFADNEYIRSFRLEQHGLKHRLGLQRTECVGLTMTEAIAAGKEGACPAWDFSRGSFRVMWTPRWTTDPKVGGTNFFEYKDALLEYAENHPGTDLLLRPHPLMFEHFKKTGEMTAAEAQSYKDRVAQMANAAFDTDKSYRTTLWGADVLISDISGIIPEFLITGKPLIFCRSNMEMELLPPMEKLLEGCYSVNNWQELSACLEMLCRGEDPKAELRRQVVEQVLKSTESPSEKILETLWQDRQ